MEALIDDLFNAAAKANSVLAMTQQKFMLDNCFSIPEKEENNRPSVDTNTSAINNYAPIMIVMSLTRGVITPAPPEVKDKDVNVTSETPTVTSAFNLPLLTIVPLNSLSVVTVDINFEMEVKSSFLEEQSGTKEKMLMHKPVLKPCFV